MTHFFGCLGPFLVCGLRIIVPGKDALPDPKAGHAECGDEFECARLQHETGMKIIGANGLLKALSA